jgi:hypothetical protein
MLKFSKNRISILSFRFHWEDVVAGTLERRQFENLTQAVSIRRSHAGTPEGFDQHSPSELKITL